jgi:hypothetical protein
MVFNATFNNISVISWRSALLVEKTTDLSQVTSGRQVVFQRDDDIHALCFRPTGLVGFL